jgi:hypothetical protein
LLGFLSAPTDGPDGDPWIVFLGRARPVCHHDADPLSLDRRTVDDLLDRAARQVKPLYYVCPDGTGRRPPLFGEWPPNVLETPTGRVGVAMKPHEGTKYGFEFEYTAPSGDLAEEPLACV